MLFIITYTVNVAVMAKARTRATASQPWYHIFYSCIPVYPVYLYSCTCIRTCTNTCITHVLKHMYYTYLYTSRNRSHGRKRARAGYHRDGKERGHSRHHPHSTVHLRSKRTVTTVHIQRCSHDESSHAGNSSATAVSYMYYKCIKTCRKRVLHVY